MGRREGEAKERLLQVSFCVPSLRVRNPQTSHLAGCLVLRRCGRGPQTGLNRREARRSTHLRGVWDPLDSPGISINPGAYPGSLKDSGVLAALGPCKGGWRARGITSGASAPTQLLSTQRDLGEFSVPGSKLHPIDEDLEVQRRPRITQLEGPELDTTPM